MNGSRQWLFIITIPLIVLASVLMLPSTAAAQDGWTWQHPLPQGNTLKGLWGNSSDYIVAVGELGTVVRYDGTSWSRMPSGTLYHLNAVWGSSRTNVLAVGEHGTILQFDGATWNTISSPITNTLYAVWGDSSVDIFAVGEKGTILHYDGVVWTSMPSGVTYDFIGVWGSGSSDVFAIARTGHLLHYDGLSWVLLAIDISQVAGKLIAGIWGSNAGIYAVTNALNGTVLRYFPEPAGQKLVVLARRPPFGASAQAMSLSLAPMARFNTLTAPTGHLPERLVTGYTECGAAAATMYIPSVRPARFSSSTG